jgi:taurine dehydrogenase small subunit
MATTEQTMTSERLDAFMDAWNAHDVEGIVSFFADDCEFHASVGPELMGASYAGRDEIRKGVTAFFERFPDGKFEDASAWVAGERGASEWTFVAGGTAVRGCDLFEFEGDRIRVKNAFRKIKA